MPREAKITLNSNASWNGCVLSFNATDNAEPLMSAATSEVASELSMPGLSIVVKKSKTTL